jgi:tetratricopeptide (TPR) repeat protein
MTRLHRCAVAVLLVFLAQGAEAQQEDRYQALIGLARLKRDAGDVVAARKYFEDARRVHALQQSELAEYFWVLAPQDPSAGLGVGRSILAGVPASGDVRETMIALATTASDESLLVELAAAGERLEPHAARWPRHLGESYLRTGRAPEAVAAFERAAAAPDHDSHDRIGLALALEASGRSEAFSAWESVPAQMRSEHIEWELSRLRAMARSVPASTAAAALEKWLQVHPDETSTRELLVTLWQRAGQPERALAVLGPLTAGPDGVKWMRRELELARESSDATRVAAALDRLDRRGATTTDDRIEIIDRMLDDGQTAQAAARLDTVAGELTSCDERYPRLLDRLPDPEGVSRLLGWAAGPLCGETTPWLVRTVERAEAASRHADALALLRRMESRHELPLSLRRLKGQLLLWTGDAAGALEALTPVVEASPADRVARASLMDAYRSLAQPEAAWLIAAPLVGASGLEAERAASIADLALEVGHPGEARRALDSVPPGAVAAGLREGLLGRVLAADGEFREAAAQFAAVGPSSLTPAAALAWIDAVAIDRGAAAAQRVAEPFDATDRDWKHVLARRVRLERIAGHDEQADALRASLAILDPVAASIADGEAAIQLGRWADAVASIASLDPAAQEQAAVLDLKAAALTAGGQFAEARETVAALQAIRPDFAPWAVKAAELSWHVDSSPETVQQVLDLPRLYPGLTEARIAAARTLVAEGRFTEVLALFDEAPLAMSVPFDGRLPVAQALHAADRNEEALAMLGPLPTSDRSSSVLRAQLTAAVRGPSAGAEAFRSAIGLLSPDPALFLDWAASTSALDEKVAILEQGAQRFPEYAPLASERASTEWTVGRRANAREAAERAVSLEPKDERSWFVLVDATAATSRDELAGVLDRFGAAAVDRPAILLAGAERMLAFVRPTDGDIIDRGLAWLEKVPAGERAFARDAARVRLLAAGERWVPAVAAARALVATYPQQLAALRLRAQVLSWAGHHAEALDAYQKYLSSSPDDLDAGREQARVAGWSGRADLAQLLYGSLVSKYPDNQAVVAEALAKNAFLASRWRAAVAAYTTWTQLEPDNVEAQFELAQSLRGAGAEERADAQLSRLETSGGYRLASAARERADLDRRTSASIFADTRSSSGEAGLRFLHLEQEGGLLAGSVGSNRQAEFSLTGATVNAGGTGTELTGSRFAANESFRLSSQVSLQGSAAWWSMKGGARPLEATAITAWSFADRWRLDAGFERRLMLENSTTLERGVLLSGPFAAATWSSPRTTVSSRTAWQTVTDGNLKLDQTVSASTALSERLPGLRALVWAEAYSFRDSSLVYFAPSNFLRADAGFEYTQMFTPVRFRGDRSNAFTVGYLVGTDNRGVRYQHPSARLSLEVKPWLSLETHGSWIRSAVYDEFTFLMGVRIVPGAASR